MTRRELAQYIESLADEGLSAAEIGQRFTPPMTRQRVMRIAAQFGVRLQRRGGKRRIRGEFSGAEYSVIRALAEQAGVSVGTMLTRIAKVVVEGGAGQAQKRLGRHALPKRPYRKARA